MSLILEALRKSEAERRRGQAPDLRVELAPVGVARRAGTMRWPGMAIAVVIVLAAMAAWILLRPAALPPDTVPAPASPRAIPRDVVVQDADPALPPVPRLVRRAPSPSPQLASTPVAPAPAPVATTTAPAAVITTPAVPSPPAPPPSPAPARTTPPTTAGSDAAVLQLADLAPGERKALPPLKLSMHLWNSDPARRLVIVDGSRLHEGDRIGDLVVTAITTDGVLLDWNGRRIQLPIH